MPHIIVKMYPGRTAEQKRLLADGITKSVMEIVNCGENAVSVSVEEVPPEDWADAVYKPDIAEKPEILIKKPGYNPFE